MVMNLWRSLGNAGRIAAVVLAAIVVGMVLWGAWRIVDAPRRAREAEIAARRSTGHADAAKDAIETITKSEARSAAEKEKIDAEVSRIQQLPEDQRYDASLRLLCGMREYSSDPRCAALQQPHSK